MKIHLDTENIKEIQEVGSLGMLDGVTTNPSRVLKEGKARLWAKRDCLGSLRCGVDEERLGFE